MDGTGTVCGRASERERERERVRERVRERERDLGEAEHVEGAHAGRLDGLDGVELVVRRRGGARQVVDLVHLQ